MNKAIGLAALALLAACGKKSDTTTTTNSSTIASAPAGSAAATLPDAAKTAFRDNFVKQCSQGAQMASANKTLDFSTICGCTADKLMASKSTTELATYNPTPAELQPVAAQCAKEHPITAG